jgi:hypothetical protein
MRLALALTVVAAALAVSATPARATPGPATCAWNETAGHPAFRHADGMAIFRRVFDCPGEAKGAYTLRFDAVVGQTRRPLETRRDDVVPRGRWPREKALHAPIARSQFCAELPAGAPVVMAPDHLGLRRRPVVAVTLEAVFEGQGDLAGLSGTTRTTVHCEACDAIRGSGGGGSVGLYEGRAMVRSLTAATRVRGQARRAWFECAQREATLSIRYFAGADDAALGRAVRPVYVQSGLERAFRAKGDDVVFEVPLPHADLCRRARGATRIAWELAGQGLLGALGGGGRSYHSLECR